MIDVDTGAELLVDFSCNSTSLAKVFTHLYWYPKITSGHFKLNSILYLTWVPKKGPTGVYCRSNPSPVKLKAFRSTKSIGVANVRY